MEAAQPANETGRCLRAVHHVRACGAPSRVRLATDKRHRRYTVLEAATPGAASCAPDLSFEGTGGLAEGELRLVLRAARNETRLLRSTDLLR